MGVAFVGGSVLSWLLKPSVRLTEHGFNELGAVLHGSIVAGSLLGMVFLWAVWTEATRRIQRVAAGLFGLALFMMAGVNAAEIVYEELPATAEFLGLGFLFVLPLALLVHGIGDVVAGRRRWGFATLALWIVYFSVWVYSFQSRTVTVLVGSIWLLLVAVWGVLQYAALEG